MNILSVCFSGSLAVLACTVAFKAHAADPIQRWHSADGTLIYLAERHELPILDIAVQFKGTGGSENLETAAVASSVASMLTSGTAALDEEAVYDRANELAAELDSSGTIGASRITMRIVSNNDRFDEAVQLMNDMIVRPRFDADVLKRRQEQAVTALKQAQSQPGYRGTQALSLLNYPNHPYGWEAKKSEALIRSVNPAKMQGYYRDHYGRDNAAVLIVGDADRSRAEQIAAAVLAGLPAKSRTQTGIPEVPLHRGQYQNVPFADTQQAIVMLGLPLVQRKDPDYVALAVGNYILGGGSFDSRLMKILRDQHGYTYGASSSFSPAQQKGPFGISFSTEKARAAEALEVTKKLLADFIAEGPTEAELQQAKDHITGSFPMYFDTNAKMAARLADMAMYDLPTDYFANYPAKVAALTTAQIKEAWQRRLNADDMNIVVVGQ